MTFREAEYDIRSKHIDSEDIVICLKEMIRTSNEFVMWIGHEIAREYYKDICISRKKRQPKIEVTLKEVRQMTALLTIGTSIDKIAQRMGYSKPTIYRVLREEQIFK